MSVDIHDLSGKRVMARELPLQQGPVVLDRNGALATGMYVMRIHAGGAQFTERVVIQY